MNLQYNMVNNAKDMAPMLDIFSEYFRSHSLLKLCRLIELKSLMAAILCVFCFAFSPMPA